MHTPVLKALYTPIKILGVPARLIAIEGASMGISLFVLRNIVLLVSIIIVHITVALIMRKETEWKSIISFVLKCNEKEDIL